MRSSPHILAGQIKARARQIGFDLVGIAPAEPSQHADYLRKWLDQGNHGTMDWLARRFDERTRPQQYFPPTRSIVCVARNYHVPLEAPQPAEPAGRIARYALGDDYHITLKDRLHELADWIRQTAGGETRCAVDTAPVMEKELAARAGIGWMGKNACIINERIGSWLLLGEILTSLPLPPDDPAIDRCGTCRRCIDACPTAAITAPYQLDARRCISYLTIEHPGPIDPALQTPIGDWLFGCDICQEVCPWNRHAPISADQAFRPRFPDGVLNIHAIEQWTADEYQATLRKSAIKRIKLPILQRNAGIVRANRDARINAGQ